MPDSTIRILLVADTHLGFDLPFRPRVQRRRRGHDFFANFERALLPALRGEVDLVVHGGDLFFRSKVPPALVDRAMAPLVRVADAGVPVYVVPGNHERSRIPLHLWAAHPHVHIFDRPRTFVHQAPGGTLALAGFPFERKVRDAFVHLLSRTRYQEPEADARVLCLHQAVEGAQVGPSDFTFRSGPDVVEGAAIPEGISAVLAGHIHRAQILTHDLARRQLAAPVIYPGSVERTAFAERHEDKAYAIVTIATEGRGRGCLVDTTLHPLPARPMLYLDFVPQSSGSELLEQLQGKLLALDPDAVVRIRLHGPHAGLARAALTAAVLRELAPQTMNVTVAPDRAAFRRRARPASRGP
jgi:DNA repair exonuclease SbcCD nuclease subunit